MPPCVRRPSPRGPDGDARAGRAGALRAGDRAVRGALGARPLTVAGQRRIRTGFPCGNEVEHTCSGDQRKHPHMLWCVAPVRPAAGLPSGPRGPYDAHASARVRSIRKRSAPPAPPLQHRMASRRTRPPRPAAHACPFPCRDAPSDARARASRPRASAGPRPSAACGVPCSVPRVPRAAVRCARVPVAAPPCSASRRVLAVRRPPAPYPVPPSTPPQGCRVAPAGGCGGRRRQKWGLPPEGVRRQAVGDGGKR